MSALLKIIAILMSFVYMLTGGNPDKVTLGLIGDPTSENEYIEIEVTNYSGKTVWIEESIVLEKEENNVFCEIKTVDGFAFNDTAVKLDNCKTYTIKINLVEAYGKKLEHGNYRISKAGINSGIDFQIT